MNLRELLLQFAGENELSLKIEEAINESLDDTYIIENKGDEIVLSSEVDISKVASLLDSKKLEYYSIEKNAAGEVVISL